MKKKKRFVIIDANSLVHRAFHAYPSHLTTSKGEQINAVYGFCVILLKVIEELEPDYLVCSFDIPKKTIRHKKYKEYKGKRKPKEKELLQQFPRVKEAVRAFNIPVLEYEGYEADDVIGTIEQDKRIKGYEKIIITGDQDLFQLVDKDTKVYLSGRNFRDSKLFGVKDVIKKAGLRPDQIVDFKSLAGDPSDNIPGVTGIGKVGAQKLILKYQDLENLYRHLNMVDTRYRNKLISGKDQAYMSQELAQIIKDVPIKWRLGECIWGDYKVHDVIEFFTELEFRSLVRKMEILHSEQNELLPPIEQKKGNDSFMIIQTKEDLSSFISLLEGQKEIALNVYCTSRHPIQCSVAHIGFYWGKKRYCIPIELIKHESSFSDAGKRIKKILEMKRIKKIGYELKHTIHALRNIGIQFNGISFDVMLAAYVLSGGNSKVSLEELAFRYLGISLQTRKEVQELDLSKHITLETELIWKLYKQFVKELKKIQEKRWSLERLFYEIEMPLIPILARMEEKGTLIDRAYLRKFGEELDKKITNEEQGAYKSVGHEFNLGSPKQVSEVLFDELDLPKGRKTKSGSYTTRDEVLEQLGGVHPVVEHIRRFREYSKLRSTFVTALIEVVHEESGRIHTTFNQAITATGRLSSSDPNLQNIPVSTKLGSKIRKAFIAEANSILVSFDYSQQELRLLAHFSGEKNLIEAFEKEVDVHALTASRIFDKPLDKVTKKERNIGKTINFGVMYGMSGVGLSDFLKIPRKRAIKFIERYFMEYSKVKVYFDSYLSNVEKQGFAETLFARRRTAHQLLSSNMHVRRAAVREIINFPIQGSAADMTKLAMIKADAVISKHFAKDVFLLLQVHDELLFEVSLSKTRFTDFKKKICVAMEDIVPLHVPLRVEISEGKNWQELKS